MSSSEFLKRQILEVSIAGAIVESHASVFRLKTSSFSHGISASLEYPSDSETGNAEDEISISVITDGISVLYFTGTIKEVSLQDSKRILILTDGYKKLCESTYVCAYRKEKASVVLDDILSAAEITEKSITCPDVELARFSTKTETCKRLIDLLIDSLKSYGFEKIDYFFDEKNIFHFGTFEDMRNKFLGKNETEADSTFESAKNIISMRNGTVETLPAPIRHSQSITVNGEEKITHFTDLIISGKKSRLLMHTQAGYFLKEDA
jgi:hypothetical protein